jgi:hypothetical protein
VEAEIAGFLGDHADKLTADGRARLVRHGHLPEREIVTGIGPVAVRCPRVRDRAGDGGERIRFSSAILPPYARRSKSVEVLIPILYLKGVSTGDFEEALVALLGKDTGRLSASTIGRLKEAWSDEHARWSKRDLSAKRYIYFWVDGIHVQARLEDHRAMPADHHRSHTRGQQGAARECAVLAGTAPRSAFIETWGVKYDKAATKPPTSSWAVDWPRARGRRWRARILASDPRGMAADARPALLGATPSVRPTTTNCRRASCSAGKS